MPSSPPAFKNKIMVSVTTKISDRVRWDHLQRCVRDKSEDFSQLLAQNFLLLDQQAKNKKDKVSIQTLAVIISGFSDLAEVIEIGKKSAGFIPEFSSAAYTTFSRLAESYNNPALLKQAGLHFMMEWRMPDTALRYFERALNLGGPENALHSLMEVAAIAAKRKQSIRKGTADEGISTAVTTNPHVSRIIRETDKLLITKTLRPSSNAPLARTMRLKSAVALPDAVKECLKEATRELANGNLAEVHRLLLKASRHPVKKEIMFVMWSNLGRAYYGNAQYAEMEEAYSHAYVHDPKGGSTYFNLALAKSLNNKVADAENLYQMAAKLDPSNAKIWCNLGVLYIQNDRFAEAEEVFRTAIGHRPDYARAWDNLASALSAQGKNEEAIEACQKAIQLRPGYPEAYFKLSGLFFGKGDAASLTEAASALSYVVNYAPLSASANALLSMIHSRMEQVEAAKASLQRAVESDPKCPLLPTVWKELETAIRSA